MVAYSWGIGSLNKPNSNPSTPPSSTPHPQLSVISPERHENWVEPANLPDDVAEVLMALVEDVQKRFPVDTDRIYLSGVSAGGSVCWELLQRHPKKFAAVAPLASGGGGTNRERLASVVDVPVWVFHAARDPLSPVTPVNNTVEILKDLGGIVHLTEIDSDYHDCWTAAFHEYRLMDWLLSQRRGRICWLRPGWTPIYLREFAVMAGVPLLLAIAVVSERRRRRRARTIADSASVPIARTLVALVLLASLSGCDPPPPGRSKPYSPALYVRGDFFPAPDTKPDEAPADASWEVCDDRNRMRYVENDRYEALIPLTVGKHQFKIADRTWHAVNLGGWPDAANMEMGTTYGMLLSEGSWNLVIDIPKEAAYRFTLHANNRQKPLLVVSQEPSE
jgi:pimeloyl-ACP methyl ester carboxylesterase